MDKPFRVLVVDDEPGIRQVYQEYLTTLGYRIETASDGLEARRKIELDIDLVVLDLSMPKMDGFEFLSEIRAKTQFDDIPIIVATGSVGVRERVVALEAGANDFLLKPVEFAELRARTANLLKMKRALDREKFHREELAATVANRTALLLKTIDDVVAIERKLEDAQLETIYRLVLATEYRDSTTAGHIMRMSQYSAMIARLKGIDKADVRLVLHASPMHDIGKISTPNEILLKPGKLTAEEWEVMKQHSVVGAQILTQSSSKLLQVGEAIAKHHHEKWNGKGYPQGLAKEEIPLMARICAVADVFDALTTERPYKAAFTNEFSLETLKQNSGIHFDPELVQLFSENMLEVEAIQRSVNEVVG